MSGKNRKSKKTIVAKFAVLALLIVSSGFTLSACQVPTPKSEKKTSDEQVKENPAVKSYQKKVDKNLKGNQSTKDNKKTSDQNKEQDTQVDDDPE